MKFITKSSINLDTEIQEPVIKEFPDNCDIETVIRKFNMYPLIEVYPEEYNSNIHIVTNKTITINEKDVTFTYSITEKPEIIKLNQAYTNFLTLCQTLGFTEKAGFEQLIAKIEEVKTTNFNLGIELSLKLLAANEMIKYYGGTWDACPTSL